MKTKFVIPEALIILFEDADLLTVSGGDPLDPENDDGEYSYKPN